MKNLTIDLKFPCDFMRERVALGSLFNYLCLNVEFVTPRIFTCFDDEIPKGYTERYRVLFSAPDGNITYSFFFSSRTNKVFVFKFDVDRNCISDRGCFYKYKLL